jgi:hypothetical protein
VTPSAAKVPATKSMNNPRETSKPYKARDAVRVRRRRQSKHREQQLSRQTRKIMPHSFRPNSQKM